METLSKAIQTGIITHAQAHRVLNALYSRMKFDKSNELPFEYYDGETFGALSALKSSVKGLENFEAESVHFEGIEFISTKKESAWIIYALHTPYFFSKTK